MNVLVIIVNYRTADLTIACLRSLAQEVASMSRVQVMVMDNNSLDDSVARIGGAIVQLGIAHWCRLFALPKNGGFASGNNAALSDFFHRAARGSRSFNGGYGDSARANMGTDASSGLSIDTPDLIWLLNPDTVVLNGALCELVDFMRSHPRVGIAGGRAENEDGSVRRSAFRFHSPLGELEAVLQFGPVSKLLRPYVIAPAVSHKPERVHWVSGASMMARREVFEKVGLLDDEYFMYYEETDFCLRAARAGFECWYVPASRVIHLVGQSSGVTGAQRALRRRPRYWFESRSRYFRKNHGCFTLHAANLLWLLGYPVGRLWGRLRRRRYEDSPFLWWDFLRYNYLTGAR